MLAQSESNLITAVLPRFQSELDGIITGCRISFTPSPASAGQGMFRFVVNGPGTYGNVAGFTILPLQNCCGICVFTELFIYSGSGIIPLRRGVGSLLTRFACAAATASGYGAMLASDATNNRPFAALMAKLGWSVVSTTHNPRSGNDINLYTYTLQKEKN